MSKRVQWSTDRMIALLHHMIVNHSSFVRSKRYGKMDNFYSEVGSAMGVSGSTIDNFIRNISRDFRNAIKYLKTSGVESEEPKLRGSSELFKVFEEYYELYYPAGGPAKPKFVLTENGLSKILSNSCQPSTSQLQTPIQTKEETQPVPDQEHTMEKSPNRPKKRQKSNNFLDHSTEIQQRHLQLQTEQNDHLASIAEELKLIRTAYYAVNDLKLVPATPETSD